VIFTQYHVRCGSAACGALMQSLAPVFGIQVHGKQDFLGLLCGKRPDKISCFWKKKAHRATSVGELTTKGGPANFFVPGLSPGHRGMGKRCDVPRTIVAARGWHAPLNALRIGLHDTSGGKGPGNLIFVRGFPSGPKTRYNHCGRKLGWSGGPFGQIR